MPDPRKGYDGTYIVNGGASGGVGILQLIVHSRFAEEGL
ncbi:MAG: hypothetical protein JWM91_1563 [Rhodospirillales bacterium]|nr:hypothetical protein [Rhodospirillales bacterium]